MVALLIIAGILAAVLLFFVFISIFGGMTDDEASDMKKWLKESEEPKYDGD